MFEYIYIYFSVDINPTIYSLPIPTIRSTDDQIFGTAVSLAERYGISKWEMFMSHLEWLFTDSE